MFSIKANPERQRGDIVSDQALLPEVIRELISAIEREAASLQPGWVAAVDFREIWVNSPFANEQFRLLQEAILGS